MSRLINRGLQLAIDILILTIAFWMAFVLRFEGNLPVQMLKRATFLTPYVIGFQYAILVAFGVQRQVWRYIGLREVRRIAMAVATMSVVLLAIRVAAGLVVKDFGYARYALLPMGVIVINAGLVFFGIVGIRVLRRLQIERRETERHRDSEVERVPTMLIGAGSAGVTVLKEVLARPDLGIEPVGFLDDDKVKVGTTIQGQRVLGPTTKLAELCEKHGAKQALITIASARRREIRRITRRCDDAGITTKIVPSLSEVVSGKVKLSEIRPVTIEDLLGRDPVDLDSVAIASFIRGRCVMVTGAGGSIGSELCRQLVAYCPAKLILVERAENSLFHVDREVRPLADEGTDVHPCMADITDERRMRQLMSTYRPDVVLHAAAHKHVPMMERNVGEAIKNNVLGTKLVADLCDAYDVANFVMVSTDKAVRPTSVMGASKRIAELYIQALSKRSETRFVTVRFGNVLGSVGSVVPIFKEQIAKGGPVTVTHPEMQRYFMTIPEACQLVLQASCMGDGGEIFILDMGEPMRILDLARDLIRLSGLKPDVDIPIRFTGIRPGEKLFEEIATDAENAEKTKHPKIFVGRQAPNAYEDIARKVQRLEGLGDAERAASLRRSIHSIVPEYSGAEDEAEESTPVDDTPSMTMSG